MRQCRPSPCDFGYWPVADPFLWRKTVAFSEMKHKHGKFNFLNQRNENFNRSSVLSIERLPLNKTFRSRFSDFCKENSIFDNLQKKKTISELRTFLTEKHKHLSTMYKLFKVVKTNNYTFWPLCSLSVRGK